MRSSSGASSTNACSIYDCLTEFAKEEVLDGDEKPTCTAFSSQAAITT
jgi:ubiquitin C-terminal hydrolase